jgi:glycosyltransferase involved in cell wall biosynthesis
MRLAIYNEPGGGGIGGAEYCAAVLASGLASEFEVELIHHRKELTAETIQRSFGEEISDASIRYIAQDRNWMVDGVRWWMNSGARRRWKAELSENCDAFISISHGVPPFCHAKTGVLYVLFPLFDRRHEWPWSAGQNRFAIKGTLRSIYFNRDWNSRLTSYKSVVSISDYTRRWTRHRWGRDSTVIWPPVDVSMPSVDRRNVILSVGRFSQLKRQTELVKAFRGLHHNVAASGWRMECCGNASDDRYYRELLDTKGSAPVEFVVDAARYEIKNRLAASKIFWHAMGYGVDEQASPNELEHFGIVTVEAMAAGCVPVVIDKGGQPEIVEHGVNGFVWSELEELEEYTVRLMQDDELRRTMSEAARCRAQLFDKERFLRAFRTLLPASRQVNQLAQTP